MREDQKFFIQSHLPVQSTHNNNEKKIAITTEKPEIKSTGIWNNGKITPREIHSIWKIFKIRNKPVKSANDNVFKKRH